MLSAVTGAPVRPTALGVKVKSGRSADHAVVEQAATKATDAKARLIGVNVSGFILGFSMGESDDVDPSKCRASTYLSGENDGSGCAITSATPIARISPFAWRPCKTTPILRVPAARHHRLRSPPRAFFIRCRRQWWTGVDPPLRFLTSASIAIVVSIFDSADMKPLSYMRLPSVLSTAGRNAFAHVSKRIECRGVRKSIIQGDNTL